MKTLLTSVVLSISLSGCLMSGLPSGIANNGCMGECQSKDFYLPGKGVWADDTKMSKAKIGGGLGVLSAVLLTHSSGDPLIISAAAVAGMFLGHEVGATFDKIDQMYLHMIFQQSMSNNNNMQSTTWKHPQKKYVINSLAVNTNGNCREFVTSVKSGGDLKQVRGTACLDNNNEWEVKEIY